MVITLVFFLASFLQVVIVKKESKCKHIISGKWQEPIQHYCQTMQGYKSVLTTQDPEHVFPQAKSKAKQFDIRITQWRKETGKVKRKQQRPESNHWDREIRAKSRLKPRTQKEEVGIFLGEEL